MILVMHQYKKNNDYLSNKELEEKKDKDNFQRISVEEIFDLYKQGQDIKKYLDSLKGSEQKTLLKLIQYHKKNESYLKSKNVTRRPKKINKTNQPPKNKKLKTANESTKKFQENLKNQKKLKAKTVISKNAGSSKAILMRIINIIKLAVENKGSTQFSVICSDSNISDSKKDLLEILRRDSQGITKAMPIFNEINNGITFTDKNGRKNKISFYLPNDQINFNSNILILGLENIRADELEEYAQDSISSLMLKIAAAEIPPPLTEFLLPEIGMEIPAEKFIKDLFDDGNLTEKSHEY